MKDFIRITSILIVLSIIFIGCSKRSSQQETSIFTDSMNRQVKIPRTVKRIVSMAPNVTEMLFAIGLDQEITGVTDYCDYPEAAHEKPRIGGYYNPNIEVILSLNPDLIVATPDGYSKERVMKLDQTGIPVFIVNPQSLEEILDSMMLLGKITGKDDISSKVVEGLRIRIKAVIDKTRLIPEQKKPKVFYEIDHDPLITAGPDNFVDSLISAAGGINIARDALSSWPRYSVEAVLIKNPDVIITAPYHNVSANSSKSLTETWKKYKTVSAVINNRVYALNPDIVLRSGPRVVDGLEELYRIFYTKSNLE